jgi:PAS domain S-box-containing protein
MIPGPLSERAIILAPSGRDSQIAVRILLDAGFPAEIRGTLAALCEEIAKGAGLAIVADEAVTGADVRPLARLLREQPPWSDFPIVLLTQRGGGPERNPGAEKLAEVLGNVTFLERPFHRATLVSVVRAAVRGRRRQYEARAHLEGLRESGERLQIALRAGRLGAWTLDARGMALRPSRSFQGHFGRAPEQPFGYADLIASIHPDDAPATEAAIRRSLESGEDYNAEFRNIWPDGTTHWVNVRARALTNAIGEVEQLVGVSSDITERKTSDLERERLLRELAAERASLSDLTETLEKRIDLRTAELMKEVAARERAQEQLLQSQKMEVIGQLTGGVAHDFNNLLMAVLGNLELLRKRVPDDARTRRLIEGAMQGAERGASLTQRMLAFARQQELKTASVDLGALLAGMRDLLERSLGPQIDLRLKTAKGLPPAQVDQNQVELAILNLAINARDAMPDGGTIRIGIDKEVVGPGRTVRPGTYLRVCVTDAGSGMDATTLKKAIEPFFSTKPSGKGTGLGLSMVHGLAVQLGGSLELTSELGKGTTATMRLPASAKPVEAGRSALSSATRGVAATILVVDDDKLIAMSTVDMLEDLGHVAIEANSAKRALEILEAGEKIDLMMTDQVMPGMTGTELAEIARRKHPGMPILLATGFADIPSEHKPNLPRLAKPYQQAQLQEQIERLLAGR